MAEMNFTRSVRQCLYANGSVHVFGGGKEGFGYEVYDTKKNKW